MTATPYLKDIDNNYSLNDIQSKIECVLEDSGYDYAKNGKSELIVEGDKDDVKNTIYKRLTVPKMVLEAMLSFHQCANSVYIRTTLR